MGIFNEFFKKEKPVFTGLKFGFGSGGGPDGPSVFSIWWNNKQVELVAPKNVIGFRSLISSWWWWWWRWIHGLSPVF